MIELCQRKQDAARTFKGLKSISMKPVLFVILLPLLTCSCYSFKEIAKSDPITPDQLSAIKPEKQYVFELKFGQKQNIYVTGVDGETITGILYPNDYSKKGQVPYSESFENIVKNVSKISVRKIDGVKTTIAIAIPVSMIIGIIILSENAGLGGLTF